MLSSFSSSTLSSVSIQHCASHRPHTLTLLYRTMYLFFISASIRTSRRNFRFSRSSFSSTISLICESPQPLSPHRVLHPIPAVRAQEDRSKTALANLRVHREVRLEAAHRARPLLVRLRNDGESCHRVGGGNGCLCLMRRGPSCAHQRHVSRIALSLLWEQRIRQVLYMSRRNKETTS